MNAIVDIDGVPHTPVRFNRERLLALMEAGVLPDDRKVEMIDGVLVEMTPAKNDHGRTLSQLIAALVPQLPDELASATDVAIYLADDVMLAPDFVVLPESILTHNAKGPDLLLAVEVADTTVRNDLRDKAPIYARHGVVELWVIDVRSRELIVCRGPGEDGYAEVIALSENDEAVAAAVPTLRLRATDVLPRTTGSEPRA